jgi:hypothetical protein
MRSFLAARLAWWSALDPMERVLYRGLALVSAGLVLASLILSAAILPLVLLCPGIVLTAIALRASWTPPTTNEEP